MEYSRFTADSFYPDDADEFDDYLELHFDDVYEELVADGFSEAEAKELAVDIIGDMFRERNFF